MTTRQWYIFLTACLIFFIPSNLFLKFAENSGYINGLLVDYLLPKIFVSDIFIVLLLTVWVIENVHKKSYMHLRSWLQKNHWLNHVWRPLFFLFCMLFFRQFFSTKPLAALWFFLKLCEMAALFFFFTHHRNVLQSTIVRLSWCSAVLFQSGIGTIQFFTQRSVFPSYLFFGEVRFSHPLQLATASFDGVEKILPYGTTAHPNILAAFFVVSFFFIWSQSISILWRGLLGIIIAHTLWLAQSASAVLAFCALFIVPIIKKIHISRSVFFAVIAAGIFITPHIIHDLAFTYPKSPSFVRRDILNIAANRMIFQRPVLGVGLNNFTTAVERATTSREVVRFVQPAHNVFLLWWAETGIVGVMFALFALTVFVKRIGSAQLRSKVLLVLPFFLFDHFLLTQQSGMLLLVLLFAT